MNRNGGVCNNIKWIGSIAMPFYVGDVAPKNLNWIVRYVRPHQFALLCAMLAQFMSMVGTPLGVHHFQEFHYSIGKKTNNF